MDGDGTRQVNARARARRDITHTVVCCVRIVYVYARPLRVHSTSIRARTYKSDETETHVDDDDTRALACPTDVSDAAHSLPTVCNVVEIANNFTVHSASTLLLPNGVHLFLLFLLLSLYLYHADMYDRFAQKSTYIYYFLFFMPQYHLVSSRFSRVHTYIHVSYRIVSYRTVSYRTVPYRTVSYRTAPLVTTMIFLSCYTSFLNL